MLVHDDVTVRHARQLRRYVADEAAILGCSELDVLLALQAHARPACHLARPSEAAAGWAEVTDLVEAELERRRDADIAATQ